MYFGSVKRCKILMLISSGSHFLEIFRMNLHCHRFHRFFVRTLNAIVLELFLFPVVAGNMLSFAPVIQYSHSKSTQFATKSNFLRILAPQIQSPWLLHDNIWNGILFGRFGTWVKRASGLDVQILEMHFTLIAGVVELFIEVIYYLLIDSHRILSLTLLGLFGAYF